jgi:hypothetical protein
LFATAGRSAPRSRRHVKRTGSGARSSIVIAAGAGATEQSNQQL